MIPIMKMDDSIENLIYNKFINLPIENKLVIYAKIVHGSSFKVSNNDIFGLNKRTVSKIYRSFINSIREDINATKKDNNITDTDTDTDIDTTSTNY